MQLSLQIVKRKNKFEATMNSDIDLCIYIYANQKKLSKFHYIRTELRGWDTFKIFGRPLGILAMPSSVPLLLYFLWTSPAMAVILIR